MNSIQVSTVGLLCLFFASAVTAWGTDCPQCSAEQDFLKVASWNADLVPGFSGNVQERLNGAIAYLTGSDVAALGFNLVCLQEVYGNGQQALINGVNGSFPYAYAGQGFHNAQCTRVCNAQAIDSLTACSAACDNDGADCLLNSCNQQFLALDSNCQACVTSGQGSASDILNMCAARDSNNEMSCSLFGGSSGNLILSNQPFAETQTFAFATQGSATSNALWAKINWRGNNINFVCTNLLPDDFMTNNQDNDNLNLQQTQELINWLSQNIPQGEAVIVAGDFNFGPAVGSNAGIYAQHYDLMVNSGLTSSLIANVPQSDVPCTSCSNGNYVTSHIFVNSDETCVNHVDIMPTAAGQVALSNMVGVYAKLCYTAQAQPSIAPSPQPTEIPSVPSPQPTQLPTVVPVIPIPEPAPIQTDIIVLPIQYISSGSVAVPMMLFSAIAAVFFF